jgi:hypothetical protein
MEPKVTKPTKEKRTLTQTAQWCLEATADTRAEDPREDEPRVGFEILQFNSPSEIIV